jgi:hypothetical protein
MKLEKELFRNWNLKLEKASNSPTLVQSPKKGAQYQFEKQGKTMKSANK